MVGMVGRVRDLVRNKVRDLDRNLDRDLDLDLDRGMDIRNGVIALQALDLQLYRTKSARSPARAGTNTAETGTNTTSSAVALE